jgi:transcriptional regulator with XRE-family HTH domain
MSGASPTVRQRELGTRLRQLRAGMGLTVEEVGEKLLCSATKISRMETGARRPTLRDVRDLCELYDVDEQTSAEFMDLAKKAREPGWWAQYDDLKLDPFIGLEQDATSITSFTAYYLPALLQTEEYARAVIKAIAPRMDPEVQEQRVAARLRRQQLLGQNNPVRYRVLLDEAALHRCVGSSAIMVAQLNKVLELEGAAKTTVQIIPFDVGAHAAQDSNFVLLEFGEALPPVVFVEGLVNNLYQERKDELNRYREAVENLRDSALTPRDSVLRITAMRDSYAGQAT